MVGEDAFASLWRAVAQVAPDELDVAAREALRDGFLALSFDDLVTLPGFVSPRGLRHVESLAWKYADEPLVRLALRRREYALAERLHGPDAIETAWHLEAAAEAAEQIGHLPGPLDEVLFERALSLSGGNDAIDYGDLVRMLLRLARWENAYAKAPARYWTAHWLFCRACDLCTAKFARDDLLTAQACHELAGFYVRRWELERALPYYMRALAIRERQLGASADTAHTAYEFGMLLWRLGRWHVAERLLTRAAFLVRRTPGQLDRDGVEAAFRNFLAEKRAVHPRWAVAIASGREAKAKDVFESCLSALRLVIEAAVRDRFHVAAEVLWAQMGLLLVRAGRIDEALALPIGGADVLAAWHGAAVYAEAIVAITTAGDCARASRLLAAAVAEALETTVLESVEPWEERGGPYPGIDDLMYALADCGAEDMFGEVEALTDGEEAKERVREVIGFIADRRERNERSTWAPPATVAEARLAGEGHWIVKALIAEAEQASARDDRADVRRLLDEAVDVIAGPFGHEARSYDVPFEALRFSSARHLGEAARRLLEHGQKENWVDRALDRAAKEDDAFCGAAVLVAVAEASMPTVK